MLTVNPPSEETRPFTCSGCGREGHDETTEDEKRAELRAYFGTGIDLKACSLLCHRCWYSRRPELHVLRSRC